MPEAVHKKYGGSVMERTEICPGSLKAIAELPTKTTSEHAERGTRIHAHMQKFLELSPEAVFEYYLQGTQLQEEEQIGLIAANEVLRIMNERGYMNEDMFVEEPVSLEYLHPEAGGTPDVMLFRMFSDLIIIDLKAGRSFVKAEDNLQGASYILGALQSLDEFTRASVANVCFIIIQPEQEAPYTPHVRTWTMPKDEFVAVYEPRIKALIDRAEANPDLRIPGDHCIGKFCDARRSCQAYLDFINEKSAGKFFAALAGETAELPPTGEGAELARNLDAVKYLKDWCKQVEEASKAALKANGSSIPGYGLQDAYGHTKWKDPRVVEKALKKLKLKQDDFMPRQLLSPTQVEKLLKTNKLECDLAHLTERNVSGVKLVEREEAQEAFAHLFDEQMSFAPPQEAVANP